MWYHLRFVPMQDLEAAAAQKRAAAEKLNVVHECTNQCAQVGFYNNRVILAESLYKMHVLSQDPRQIH